jgi:hypothetical protein
VRVVGESHIAIGGKVELTLLQSRSGIIVGQNCPTIFHGWDQKQV